MRLFFRKMPTGLLYLAFCIKETASFLSCQINLPSPSSACSTRLTKPHGKSYQTRSLSGRWNSLALMEALHSSKAPCPRYTLHLYVSAHLISCSVLQLGRTTLMTWISTPCWYINRTSDPPQPAWAGLCLISNFNWHPKYTRHITWLRCFHMVRLEFLHPLDVCRVNNWWSHFGELPWSPLSSPHPIPASSSSTAAQSPL